MTMPYAIVFSYAIMSGLALTLLIVAGALFDRTDRIAKDLVRLAIRQQRAEIEIAAVRYPTPTTTTVGEQGPIA